MTSKIDRLEKLLAESEGKWDWEHEVLDYCEALRNSAPLLLEIVKAAKAWADESRYDIGHDKLNLTWLCQALAEFEESEL